MLVENRIGKRKRRAVRHAILSCGRVPNGTQDATGITFSTNILYLTEQIENSERIFEKLTSHFL